MGTKVDDNIIKAFPKKVESPKGKNWVAAISLAVVLAGLGTGYLLSQTSSKKTNSSNVKVPNVTVSQNEAGVGDDSSFPDTATGILVEGGIKGEGTYHLERPGGPSQNVYLTSTVINLQSFVGKKVEVHGQTLSAVNAGWLMDVGKIKVVN